MKGTGVEENAKIDNKKEANQEKSEF